MPLIRPGQHFYRPPRQGKNKLLRFVLNRNNIAKEKTFLTYKKERTMKLCSLTLLGLLALSGCAFYGDRIDDQTLREMNPKSPAQIRADDLYENAALKRRMEQSRRNQKTRKIRFEYPKSEKRYAAPLAEDKSILEIEKKKKTQSYKPEFKKDIILKGPVTTSNKTLKDVEIIKTKPAPQKQEKCWCKLGDNCEKKCPQDK